MNSGVANAGVGDARVLCSGGTGGLRLHRSERADAMVGPLAELLSTPPDDPFTPDVVCVPTQGVERWLAQRLSHRLGAVDGGNGEAGVCANVEFRSPARLVGDVLSQVLGTATDDPWHPDRLVWPLLAVLDAASGQPWCAVLDRHLGAGDPQDSHRRSRRYALGSHLARLFASYAAQRPSVLLSWADGQDGDGAGGTVPDDLAWQPELWRRLRADLGTPSPAERLKGVLSALRDRPDAVDLPARLSVWGPTRVPQDQLEVLTALAPHRDVHLWLLQPSPVLWERLRAPLTRRRAAGRDLARHPLLSSLARDAVELRQRLALAAADLPGSDTHHPAALTTTEGDGATPAGTTPAGTTSAGTTLLSRLQQQLRDDEPPSALSTVDPADRSVQVHACHGRARQVEVLRETLLQLFTADETLEPRDVLVMCPDIEELAPLVSATFGLAPDDPGEQTDPRTHPGHRLRVRLADRSPQHTNPLLSLLARLLALADSRVAASEVLDLLSTEPVRRRFSLSDDDLDRITGWTVETGTRWGEDRGRRARFGLDRVGQGTWEAGLDRILLGATMADEEQRWLHTALPLDDVDSTDLDLTGRLAELVERLTGILAELDGTRPLSGWLDTLDRSLDLLADTPPADAWQVVQARRVLADVRSAGADHDTAPLRLADVRALLAGRLEGRPTRAGFRTGHLTVCSMVPMRSVPHRVVCLLGLDDGTFPRGTSVDGDDLLLRDPLLGERDRRSEDRQLFLDAVLAAQEHLVVLYSGADERTGALRPPAVPVGELLDVLDRTASLPGGSVRDHVLVRHPLQPFDARAFTPGALGTEGPASFDVAAHAGALAARGPRLPDVPFLPTPLPAATAEDVIELDDLARFHEQPVRTFLRARLGMSQSSSEDEVVDRLPLESVGLDGWRIGDRLLQARLAGADVERASAAEWRRGELPPGRLGSTTLTRVLDAVEPIVAAAQQVDAEPSAVDVAVGLHDGRTLTGTVPVRGDVVLRAVYSSLGAKHRLRAWVQLLALAAGSPATRWRAVTLGKGQGRRPAPRRSVLTAPPPEDALLWLEQLADVRDRGLRAPLPLAVKTSAAYAAGRAGGNTVEQACESADREWRAGRFGFGEAGDEEHTTVWGPDTPLRTLLAVPAAADELTWWLDEQTRFGALARRVWEPLLSHESLETL